MVKYTVTHEILYLAFQTCFTVSATLDKLKEETALTHEEIAHYFICKFLK